MPDYWPSLADLHALAMVPERPEPQLVTVPVLAGGG